MNVLAVVDLEVSFPPHTKLKTAKLDIMRMVMKKALAAENLCFGRAGDDLPFLFVAACDIVDIVDAFWSDNVRVIINEPECNAIQ